MKSLVVYFSLTGSTEFVAKIIADQLGADLCEVVNKKHKKGDSVKSSVDSVSQKCCKKSVDNNPRRVS